MCHMEVSQSAVLERSGSCVREADRQANCHPVDWRRPGRERLRRRRFLARYGRLLDRTFFNRPYRLARHAIEDVEPTDLMRQRHSFDSTAVDVDVRQHWRGRVIEIPNRMMNELVI